MDKKVQGLIFNPYILALLNIVGLVVHIIMGITTETWTLEMTNTHGIVFTIMFAYNLIWIYMIRTYMITWKK